jgi:uncharacterized membrane protein YidH (DUF202 family)
MSTIAYAQLTNLREQATPDTSTSEEKPGLRTYIDAFAALFPAEVLTLHAAVMAYATEKTGESVNFKPDATLTVTFAFWGMVVLSIVLFAVPRYFGGTWDKFDWIRVSIAPLAFIGWTMLQPMTAFDAAFEKMPAVPRGVGALFLGAILGGVTAALALKADKKPPVP